MQIAPDTVVYVDKAGAETPERGLFAVVRFEAGNRSETSVTNTVVKGGFRWKTPDGKTVKAGNGKGAGRIAAVGFSEGGPDVSPKTYQVDTVAFDITAAEKGGTLVYVDGVAFRWKEALRNGEWKGLGRAGIPRLTAPGLRSSWAISSSAPRGDPRRNGTR